MLKFTCQVEYGKAIYVMGNAREFGNDDFRKALRMEWTAGDKWKRPVEMGIEREIASENALILTFFQSPYEMCRKVEFKGKKKIKLGDMILNKLIDKWQTRMNHNRMLFDFADLKERNEIESLEHMSILDSGLRDFSCVVCQEKERDVMFMNCNHICCCSKCASTLPSKKCPACRADIQRTVNVYIRSNRSFIF